ncbi:hypothetical protein NQZ68_039860 [Dissostichus eleginoides]|nr:hypothetical protein NQZ68_039860 [Dissostichus eleginoides]
MTGVILQVRRKWKQVSLQEEAEDPWWREGGETQEEAGKPPGRTPPLRFDSSPGRDIRHHLARECEAGFAEGGEMSAVTATAAPQMEDNGSHLNRVIPATSSLWRQEVDSDAVLCLWTHVV